MPNVNVVALNEILRKQGRSKTWLAEQVGMSRDHLYHMLGDERPCWGDLPELIARALDVDVKAIAVLPWRGQTGQRRRAS